MRKVVLLAVLFLAFTQLCLPQARRFSLDMSLEQNFFLKEWCPNERYSEPLIDRSTDLSFRLNWNAVNYAGLWAKMAMVFGNGSKMESAENYLDMFSEDFNLDLDNYYVKDLDFDSHINRVPTMRVAAGAFFRVHYKRCKFVPYIGGGFESISTAELRYDLKEKNTNNLYEVDYAWGGKDPNVFLGFISAEMKFAYTFYPKRDLVIGLIYRSFLTKPEFRRTIKNYYRESENETLRKDIKKGNLVNSLGISVGINFR